MKYLSGIESPTDLKKLAGEELVDLAAEIRHKIISTVSHTGGHLATNLGAVELTIALHYVFNLPQDQIVWDVSHQVYAHKLLTGRRDRFDTIRQHGGLAGFTKRSESEYDHYGAGHASTSISAALGLACARDQAGLDHKVMAIIGDGSMTGGLAFEGLNHAGSAKKDLLVVLNDNTWSISKNVGALSKYLTGIMTDEKFNRLRDEVWELTGRFKRREQIRKTIANLEHSINSLLVPGMLFQKLGFRYFGPIDGHDLPLVIKTLERIKNLSGPLMLHVATVKGKGYEPAENNPGHFHGVGAFDKVTGKPTPSTPGLPSYTKIFGDTMVELGHKDKRVVAITAAMTAGTGLVKFGSEFPERLIDVGIAEGHASCLAGGLAVGGQRPYVVVYSTFMQRAYDQVIHDIALQELPVVYCMDRGGLVGDDGPTHHGVFDLSYMSTAPNLTMAVPRDGNELRAMLHWTIENDPTGPVAIRYPRANTPTAMTDDIPTIEWGCWEHLTEPAPVVALAVGTMVETALQAREILSLKGIDLWVINARFVSPMDMTMLKQVQDKAMTIVTMEENVRRGGFGQAVASHLLESGYAGRFKGFSLPDKFVTHGNRSILLKESGLDAENIAESILALVPKTAQGEPDQGFLKRLVMRRNDRQGSPKKEEPLARAGGDK
jgi:1-deoxy-D-xylulose-5-phosphate synthase